MIRTAKLVWGVGINDADYAVSHTMGGVRVRCTFYQCWYEMLRRCYSARLHKKRPTYIGCTVCVEWLIFSTFKKWMEKQNHKGNQLDKDILFKHNKVYSPETCVFVPSNINSFLVDCASSRGKHLVGVSWHKQHEKFYSSCQDGDGKQVFLGLFDVESEAHEAWKKFKHVVACLLADSQSDSRVAEALRKRYSESLDE